MAVGDAVFIETDQTGIKVGPDGMCGLMTYPGPDPVIALLQESGERMIKFVGTSAPHSSKSSETVEVQA